MKNKFLATVVPILAIFGFLSLVYFLTVKPKNVIPATVSGIRADDHIKWSTDQKIVLIEYSDFYCPACKIFNGFIKQFEASDSSELIVSKKITFVFRHFPIHEQSFSAAYAAEAAAKQGKYYEMIDLIFDNQESLIKSTNQNEIYVKLARDLGLDTEKFKHDLQSTEVKNKVEEDFNSAKEAGVNATPTFFLNGQKLEITSFDEFKQTLFSVAIK